MKKYIFNKTFIVIITIYAITTSVLIYTIHRNVMLAIINLISVIVTSVITTWITYLYYK